MSPQLHQNHRQATNHKCLISSHFSSLTTATQSSGLGPANHLAELGIPTIANLPVGERLQDQPFFYNVYALKPEAKAMQPASGAIVWTHSQHAAPGDLDLHISGTHLIDPNASPTGGAIVRACAVTLPKAL